jgi:hypothetical protein
VVAQQVVEDDQDAVGDGQDGPPRAPPPCQAVVLCRQGVAGGTAKGLGHRAHERLPPGSAWRGPAAQALATDGIQQELAAWEDEDAEKRAIQELVDDQVRWMGAMVERQLRLDRD